MGRYQPKHREGLKQSGQVFGTAHGTKPPEVSNGKMSRDSMWSHEGQIGHNGNLEVPFTGEDKKGYRGWKPDNATIKYVVVCLLIAAALSLLLIKWVLG